MPSRWFRKEGILPVALGLAALGVASYFLLFAPELRTIGSLRAEIAAKDAEVAEAMKLRTEVAQSRVGEGARWEERLRTWERRVPSTPDTEHLLAEIGEMAVRHNLKAFGLTVAPAAGPAQGGAAPDPAAAGAGAPAQGKDGSRGSPVPPHLPVHLPGPRGVPRRDPAGAAPADDPVGVGQGKGGRHGGGNRAVGLAPEGAMKPIREWMGDKRVAAVLAGVAILFVGYRLIGSGIGSAPAVPATAVAPSPSAAVQEPAPTSAAPSPPPASSALPIPPGWTGPAWSWNRNPFLGPAAESSLAGRTARNGNGDAALVPRPEGPSPELRGTVVSGAAAMAIIRRIRLVPVGGKVGDWTLSRVEPYRVFLRRGNETRVLELYKQ